VEVSTTVVTDMVRPEQIVTELSARLNQPAFARSMLGKIEALIPDLESVRTFVHDVWEETLHERVVDWLIGLDLRDAFEPPAGDAPLTRSPVHEDPIIRAGVHRCLTSAVNDEVLSRRLYNAILAQYGDRTVFEIPPIRLVKPRPTPVSFEAVARFAVDEEALHQKLGELVDQLLGPLPVGAARPRSPIREALRDYARAYAQGWLDTPEAERRQAAARLVQRLIPGLLDEVAESIWEHRNQLGQIVERDLPLNAHPLVEYLVEEVGGLVRGQLETLDERSQGLLTTKLRAMGPQAFRLMLERRTRGELDWIQVNGAVLGLVLGTLAGLVTAGLHVAGIH